MLRAIITALGNQSQRKAGARRLFTLSMVLMAWVGSVLFSQQASAAELLMFTRKFCPFCVLWERQIAPIYPKTAEAEVAPLRRVNLDQVDNNAPVLHPPVTITPTFVLMNEGKEIGRFVGYSDDLTFWSVLATQLAKIPPAAASPEIRTKALQ